MKILGIYTNNDYQVAIFEDGTKIRYNKLESFHPVKPECIDLKITNRCDMGCAMCFAAGTKILMGDYTYKNIEDVVIGDEVIGFEEHPSQRGTKRKCFKTKVTETFVHVESDLIKATSDTGNVIYATPNHPFFSEGTAKNHSRLFNEISRIPVGGYIFEYGFPISVVDYESQDYSLGYVIGAWVGDGSIYRGIDKNGYEANSCRFVTMDEEINDRVYDYTMKFIPHFYRLDFTMPCGSVRSSVRSNRSDTYDKLLQLVNENIGDKASLEYACGFLAGFCDSEGHVDNQSSIIRLFNTNTDYIDEVARCLGILNIEYVIEERHSPQNKNPKRKDYFSVRIFGKSAATKFLWYTRPVCKRKSLENYMSTQTQYYKQKIMSKEIIEKKQYVYNFATECHTYVANNFLVHNCHEDSSPDGQHGDILNLPFLDSLLPYTELAIGGGNPLEHPDLTEFLAECRKRKIIANMTVNQKHFVDNWMQIDSMLTFQEIYGLGVSVTRVDEEFLNFVRYMNGMNIVFHVINGVIEPTELEKLYGMGYKILILGYKQFRRGEKFYSPAVQARMDMMSEKLPEILTQFNVVSFDNLALKQLPVREQMSDEDWEKFYMGDDGQFTMYIDAVKREFAKSSTSTERWPITGDIAEMFGVVKGDNK